MVICASLALRCLQEMEMWEFELRSDECGPDLHENKKNSAVGNVYGDTDGIVYAD